MEKNISIPCPAGRGMFMFVKKSGQSFLLHFAHRLSVYQKNTRAIAFYQREQFVIHSENIDDSTNEKEFIMVWNK